jgi:zinc-ribbon domain/Bacterial SH3 domain
MFCTHCGTQIDEGKKFCKNCGASIAKVDELAATMVAPKVEPTSSTQQTESIRSATWPQAPVSETQPITMLPKQRHGISPSVVITIVALLVLIGGGVGVYFGTDLFREPAAVENAPVPEPMVSNPEPPPMAPIEGDKIPEGPSERDLNAALQSAPAEPLPAPPVESPKNNEPAPKPAAKSNVPAQDRVAKAPTPPSTPRRPAFNPGTYETLRATNVFDGPSPSAHIVAGIERGVRINVVASNGDWLEVRSRHGNPPGFIRKDDARSVE